VLIAALGDSSDTFKAEMFMVTTECSSVNAVPHAITIPTTARYVPALRKEEINRDGLAANSMPSADAGMVSTAGCSSKLAAGSIYTGIIMQVQGLVAVYTHVGCDSGHKSTPA
jgi:hypothetical protein